MALAATDELAHPNTGWPPGCVETWTLTFGDATQCAGRIATTVLNAELRVSVVVLHPEYGPVIARDRVARRDNPFEVRGDGIWINQCCETPFEHWTYGLEAFGVEFESARDAWEGERGHRLPLGFDLEWEVGGAAFDAGSGYVQPGRVQGDVIIGDATYALDTAGVRAHWWNVDDAAPSLWWHDRDSDVFVRSEQAVQWRVSAPNLLDVRSYLSTVDTLGFPTRVDVTLGHNELEYHIDPVDWVGEVLDETPLNVLPHAALRVTRADGTTGFGWQVGAATGRGY